MHLSSEWTDTFLRVCGCLPASIKHNFKGPIWTFSSGLISILTESVMFTSMFGCCSLAQRGKNITCLFSVTDLNYTQWWLTKALRGRDTFFTIYSSKGLTSLWLCRTWKEISLKAWLLSFIHSIKHQHSLKCLIVIYWHDWWPVFVFPCLYLRLNHNNICFTKFSNPP